MEYVIVVSAVIFRENYILLAKRSMNEDVLPGYWGIPGGKVEIRENGDAVLEKELQREISEEVGIRIKNIGYLESHFVKTPNGHKIHICFVADYDAGKAQALQETEEVAWLDFNKIKKLKLTPYTSERIKLAFISRKSHVKR